MDTHSLAIAAGLDPAHVVPAGRHGARVDLAAIGAPRAHRYVLVTAVTPTPAGEGKTVTTIGLSMALAQRGVPALATLRRSSLGPTFGRKGGGAGGGAAVLAPLTAALLDGLPEFAAVEAAHNLLAAAVDDTLHRERHGLTPETTWWRRVADVNDRALRDITVGLGATEGPPRRTGVDITAAGEVMAVLSLARDLPDLRARLGRLVVGTTRDGAPVTAEDLGAAGAMAALLRDAAEPGLVGTAEGTPVLLHGGPFGNLSTGTCSVIADRVALASADVVVTEAGFGADLGAEKFLHLKVPLVGRAPDVAVVVVTVRAMRWHGGVAADAVDTPDLAAVTAGTANLRHHIERLVGRGLPVVVAVNLHDGEQDDELDAIAAAARDAGAAATVTHRAYQDGGKGTLALADAVLGVAPGEFTPLVGPDVEVATGLELRARQWYGAGALAWSPEAEARLAWLEQHGFGRLPVCVAKAHQSVSHDPTLRGAPRGFTFPVRELRLAAGAGYVTALAGDVLTMPGLPEHPRFLDVDLDEDGEVVGLV